MFEIDKSGEDFCKKLGDIIRKHRNRKGKLKWERLLIELGAEVLGAEARLQHNLTPQEWQRLRRRIKVATTALELLPTVATTINVRQEEHYLDRMAKDLLRNLEVATIVKVVEDAVTLYTELRMLVGRKIIVLTTKLLGSRPDALMNGGNPKRFLKRLNGLAEILNIVVLQD
jgi:hypothetical protein